MATGISQLFDPIYALLDKEEFIECIDYISKKQTLVLKFPLGQALLSYAQVSAGQKQAGLDTAKAVVRNHFHSKSSPSKPMDESLLNTLGCSFKQLREDKDLIDLYESAINSTQNITPAYYSESVFLELFSTYSRKNDPKGMQHTAQRMYKSFNVPKYMCWVVGCIVLQLQLNVLPPTMLVVAEKMMQKYQDILKQQQQQHKGGSEEFFNGEDRILFVHLLLRLGKYQECLDLLPLPTDDDVGKSHQQVEVRIDDAVHLEKNPNLVSSHPLNRRTHRIDVMLRLFAVSIDSEQKALVLGQIISELRSLLTIYLDQWNIHQLYVNCTLSAESVDVSSVSQYSFPDYDFERRFGPAVGTIDAQRLILHQDFLKELQLLHPKIRGPFIAELLLLTKSVGLTSLTHLFASTSYLGSYLSLGDAKLDDSVDPTRLYASELVCNYIWKFRYKQCCFSDLRSFVYNIFGSNEHLLKAFLAWLTDKRDELLAILNKSVSEAIHSPSKTLVVTDTVDETEGQEDEKEEEGGNPKSNGPEAGNPSAGEATKKKKKKKKKKAGKAESAAKATYPELAIHPVVEEHSNIILDICAFCKIDQFLCYSRNLLFELNQNRTDVVAEVSLRLKTYNTGRALFLKGVGGEVRNVQPGDELILENSSFYRRSFLTAVSDNEDLKSVIVAVRWAQSLLEGMEASPYSFAFKVDVLEPLRILSAAQPALVAFNGLGTKYIQLDSLSYLILPNLVEASLFSEAVRLHKQICTFHLRSAQKDTFENMGRCFEFGNYLNALDLQEFATRCKRSYQLALSRSELPLLELLTGYFSLNDALSFLKKIEGVDSTFLGAQPLLLDSELDELVSNMDYSLLVRTDGPLSELDAEAAVAKRKLRMRQRIQVAQHSSRVLLHFLSGDMSASESHLISLFTALELDSKVSESGSLQWDPTFQSPAQSQVWIFVESSISFLIGFYRFQSIGLNDADSFGNLFPKLKKIMRNFEALKSCLELPSLSDLSEGTLIIANSVAVRSLFAPKWLKSLSLVSLTVVSWIPLLLQFLFKHTTLSLDTLQESVRGGGSQSYPLLVSLIGKEPYSGSKKRSWLDRVEELEAGWTVKEDNPRIVATNILLLFAEFFLSFFGDLKSTLPVETDQVDGGLLTDVEAESLQDYFLLAERSEGQVVEDGQYLKLALDSILSSHSLSFARLHQLLDIKTGSIVDCITQLVKST